jgi:thymidylate synthase (FAD)
MKIIEPSYKILDPIIASEIYKKIAECGHTAYQNYKSSDEDFIKKIMKDGHLSVIEHVSITVRFIHNRGFSHELVRHRLASFTQESTRYCNYSAERFGNELTFIEPYWKNLTDPADYKYLLWKHEMKDIEEVYMIYLKVDTEKPPLLPPQAARGILPNDLKTDIVVTANLREWKHIFELRTSEKAHPDMVRVMKPLKEELQKLLPLIFGEI